MALLGDVGIDRDEAGAPRQRLAADGDDAAVRADALDGVRLQAAGGLDALHHQRLDVARPVFAALGVVAHEGGKRRAAPRQLLGKLQHLEEDAVPRDQLELPVEDGDPLVDVVEPGLDQQERRLVRFCSPAIGHPCLSLAGIVVLLRSMLRRRL